MHLRNASRSQAGWAAPCPRHRRPPRQSRTLDARGAGAHHAGHDHFDLSTTVPLLSEFGLNEIESGAVAFSLLRIERLNYVIAAAPTDL